MGRCGTKGFKKKLKNGNKRMWKRGKVKSRKEEKEKEKKKEMVRLTMIHFAPLLWTGTCSDSICTCWGLVLCAHLCMLRIALSGIGTHCIQFSITRLLSLARPRPLCACLGHQPWRWIFPKSALSKSQSPVPQKNDRLKG